MGDLDKRNLLHLSAHPDLACYRAEIYPGGQDEGEQNQ